MTLAAPHRYASYGEDSARWIGFPFRAGDIVISTRAKSGTTWMQMICALLVFGSPELPRKLTELSPWLDLRTRTREEVYALLEAQRHRRFVKTHTPLDGLPIDRRATYIVVARHPLDMAVSLYHQGDNVDPERFRELVGAEPSTEPAAARPPVRDWLLSWVRSDADPRQELDSLPGVLWHLSDAWARRDEPNIVLVHYDDLAADLDGEMRRLADRLGIAVSDEVWPELVRAASFDAMKRDAERLVPDQNGIFKDLDAFFRRGTSGAGRGLLDDDELAAYHARAAELAPSELLAWLHRD